MFTKSAMIVLVGLCNEEPLLQDYIGTIVFRKNYGGEFEPQLINIRIGEEKGTNSNPFKPKWQWKKKGSYGLSFGDVFLKLDADNSKYFFSTGTYYDSGSSGPISNGGLELIMMLDALFADAPAS